MRVARSSRARAGCVTGCLVRLMAVLLVIGVATLVIFTVILVRDDRITPEIAGGLSDAVVPQRSATGQASVVPPGEDHPGGLLVFITSEDGARTTLSYLEGDPLDVRWESGDLSVTGESAPFPPVLTDESVYLVEGTRLEALDLADGERRWSVELSAALPPGCASCIQPLEGAVTVLTEDQMLSVLSAEDGELMWQAALSTLPREVAVIGGDPAVIDTLPDAESSALVIFDTATGEVRARFEPRCQPDADAAPEMLAPGSPLLYDAGSGALYFLFGFVQHGCAQRWDADTGEMVWSASFPLETSGWPRTWTATAPLLDEDRIIFASAEGASILTLDTADGALHTLIRSDAYMLKPWAQTDDTLLVRAERLDTLEQDELWGVRLPDGEQAWRYPITRDNSSWTAHSAPGGFAVIELASDPARLRVTLLDATTGEPVRDRVQPVSSVTWTGTTWAGDRAWLTIGALYELDLHNGIPAQVWPAPEPEKPEE